MRQVNRTSIGVKTGLALLAVTLMLTGTLASAQQESILHSFGGAGDGTIPYGGLIFDAAGNLYGTTSAGGAYGGGTVFELSPQPGGGWTEEILRYFGSGTDAKGPRGSLIFDAAGNLYGTTLEGGAYGEGAVFELFPKPGGGWREQDKILHSFNNNGQDGYQPWAGLIFDSSGNLYGTAIEGGAHGDGVVFQLVKADGVWIEKILHNFDGRDGTTPIGGLIFDSSGNLYGTAALGGTNIYDEGAVFELERGPGGGWSERILYSFNGPDGNPGGYYPAASLTFDTVGNLYGTTEVGGPFGEGVAFEMTPMGGGVWAENVIYNFPGGGSFNPLGGYYPSSALIFDTAGNLYGAAGQGGANHGGAVFKLVPTGDGSWSYNALYNFGESRDGTVPNGNLIFDAAGNLYGVTSMGGTHDYGMVFEITP
jgi:uncharacterized repeat protein (TIGR03803 family)